MATILLMGMEEMAARRIEGVLTHSGFDVRREPYQTHFAAPPRADVVFLWGDHRDYGKALEGLRSLPNTPPVVVTTRLPDSSDWIDSCEAGVAAYCVAPFDEHHIQWTVESAMARKRESEKTMAA